MEHVRRQCNCGEPSCWVENLWVCAVCGGWEGCLTTECPGEFMTGSTGDMVYAGCLDYFDGKWQVGYHSTHSPVKNTLNYHPIRLAETLAEHSVSEGTEQEQP